MRAKTFMRFGGTAQSAAFYDSQTNSSGRQFFTVSPQFKAAVTLPAAASEQQIVDAILAGASHMSVRDPQNVLYAVQTKGVTLEAFVRIRDRRVLFPSANRGALSDAFRIGGPGIRLPIMGNMLHRSFGAYYGQGYQLSCAYDGGPVCCAEAYTVSDRNSFPTKPSVSACVSIAELLNTRDPGAPVGETGWFHITGTFSGGRVEVMVNESSAYYSQSAYSAYKAAGSVSDTIQVKGKLSTDLSAEPATAFRIASTLPITANGDVIHRIDNYQYLFLKCDIDEIRVWVRPNKAVRTIANSKDVYEGWGTCPVSESAGLVLYVKERAAGNAVNSTITIPKTNTAPLPVSGNVLVNANLLAVNVDHTLPAYYQPCTSGEKQPQIYKHFLPCDQTYVDRRVEAVSSMLSQDVELDTRFQWVDWRDANQGQTHRVDLWEFSPEKGVGSARVVFQDHNFNDQVNIIKKFPTKQLYMFLDYLFDVEQFNSGLPFYNIAKDKTLDSFVNDGRGIPQVDPIDGQVWNELFKPNLQDSDLCLVGKSNCDGIKVNLNLTLPDPWYGATFCDPTKCNPTGACTYKPATESMACAGGLSPHKLGPETTDSNAVKQQEYTCCQPGVTWDQVCPSAFEDQGIDASYRFLCTEWWVPYGRGWPFHVSLKETPCAYADQSVDTEYRAKIGYEARPEWYSNSEAPFKKAADAGDVGAGSAADCPDPDTVIWTQVGSTVESYFRARDRNKDDAVDIVPADDPGLPNGAILFPALPARARNVTTQDTTRPRLYERIFTFTPEPSQVDQTYRVCMKARSYRHEATPLQFQVDSEEAYLRQLGDTVETMPYQTCADPSSGTCPPTMWMDRCVFVKVAPPEIEFGCSPDIASATCDDADYAPGGRLSEGATLEFTAGDTACSDTITLEARDVWQCPDVATLGLCPPSYNSDIYLDREASTVPDSFVVVPEGKSPQKSVRWTPTAGKDETLEGYKACFIAADHFGMSKTTRCFVVKVRKCKYCLPPGETLADVGRRFQVDWLQIYMANPHISTPDNVPRTIPTINTGVFYSVRAGDYLELLGQKFFMTLSQLRLMNPDVPADGLLTPGMSLCIMPPVCDVKCLYGTDCHIY